MELETDTAMRASSEANPEMLTTSANAIVASLFYGSGTKARKMLPPVSHAASVSRTIRNIRRPAWLDD